MNLHNADVANRFRRYLDRRQLPRRLEGKANAEADEIRAITDAVMRYAPRGADALAQWWPVFEARLGEIVSGGLWPTEKEIRDAAAAARPQLPKASGDEWALDTYTIMGRRMAAGEPVGEGYLYGREACELIKRKLVDQETMERYRKGAFMNRRAVYGHEKAVAWEAEAKARHEAAKGAFRDDSPAARQAIGYTPRTFGEAAE